MRTTDSGSSTSSSSSSTGGRILVNVEVHDNSSGNGQPSVNNESRSSQDNLDPILLSIQSEITENFRFIEDIRLSSSSSSEETDGIHDRLLISVGDSAVADEVFSVRQNLVNSKKDDYSSAVNSSFTSMITGGGNNR